MSTPNINNLTIGETAKIEELAGQSISALADENAPKAKLLAALAFVFKRREDPAFTWNQAMDLGFDEIMSFLNLDGEDGDDADPLEQSAKQPASKKSKPKTAPKK